MTAAPSLSRRLLALVDDAGTCGASAIEARDALGVSVDVLADLVRRMLAADRAWLDSEAGRLYSTAPL